MLVIKIPLTKNYFSLIMNLSMKITVYTTSACQFSQKEKEYLRSRNLVFEEKNLETNREFLSEMLSVSNNFAGTPVTKIEKDDGQIVILKGFTQEEFDQVLGQTQTPAPTPEPPKVAAPLSTTEPKPTMAPEPAPVTTTPEPSMPKEESPAPPPAVEEPLDTIVSPPNSPLTEDAPPSATTPTQTTPQSNPMDAVLKDLQSLSETTSQEAKPAEPTIPPPPSTSNPSSEIPAIPNFNDTSQT